MDKSKIVSSLIYKFVERFAVKGLGLIISIVLARLMAPEYFGQIAILTVVINLSLIFIEGGLSSALIQSNDVDDRDYSTVFYISVMLSAVLILLLHITSPLIAAFYKSPELVNSLKVYSFALLPMSFDSIQAVRLKRDMRFKEIMLCNLIAAIGSGIVGIWLAFKGLGLWALVVYYMAQIFIACGTMFYFSRWIPRSRFSMDSAKRLYSYGIRILGASLITAMYSNLRTLIIGKKFSTEQLGLYDRGQRFSSTISVTLDNALYSVMFPVLSRAQDDLDLFNESLRKTRKMCALFTFPLLFGVASVADPMVRLLLTEEWLPCIIYTQLLCIAEAQIPLTTTNLVAIQSIGRSDILFKLTIIRFSLMLLILIISIVFFDSMLAIAVSYLIGSWLDTAITSLAIHKILGYKFSTQFKDIWKSTFSTVIMALIVYSFGFIALSPALKLFLQIMLGAVIYMAANIIVKNESFFQILSTIRKNKA